MKNLLVVLLCIVALLAFSVSCGASQPATTTTVASLVTDTPTVTTAPITTTTVLTTEKTPETTPVNETFYLNDFVDSYYNETARPGENDKMEFSSHWGVSQGYYSRFFAGDEHWVTADRGDKTQPATCTITFFGHSIEVYGHTCPAGGMVSVTLDGEVLDEIPDFYSASRTEALPGKYTGTLKPFLTLTNLENTEHTLVITLLRDQTNPKQSGNAEIAVDYAIVTRLYGSNPSAGANIPAVDTAFEGYIGNAQEYMTTADYMSLYEAFGETTPKKNASLRMFQGDLVNSRIDLLIGENTIRLTASASEFRSSDNNIIPADCIQLAFLNAVRDHESNQMVYDILGDSSKTMLSKSCGALWVAISTKANTPAGTYRGTITITTDCCERNFPYEIEVVGVDITTADAFLSNELWMYPYSACRYYSGKGVLEYFGTDHSQGDKSSLRYVYLDDACFDQLAAQIRLYAEAGGDIITATLLEDAWNNQTTDPYPSMVKWTRNKDGKWVFDYTDFDKWVELNMANGVNSKIKCYSIGSWNSKIYFLEEKTGKVSALSASTGSTTWQKAWTAFLTDFMKHLKEKGWFEITYLSMDERSTDEIAAVCNLVSSIQDENGKTFKMSMAVNRLTSIQYFDYFEDLAISSSQRNGLGTLVADRTAKGLNTSFYTCGATAGSLRNQPYETVDFFYFLYKKGCNGYLRWAFDSYTDDPLENTYHWRFVAGDQNLIYPDEIGENATVQSSVRYQIMIESYKNICALKAVSNLSTDSARKVSNLLTSFSGYSANMQSEAATMENGIFLIAKQALK